jgi:hypothetical protein
MLNIEDRSSFIALALGSCTKCDGSGVDQGKSCACVNRGVFRAVLRKFRECATYGHNLRPRSIEAISGPQGKTPQGCKNSEYLADVHLTGKRTLSTDDWRIFSAHHLLGADWKLCCQRLGMSRGNFFHACYRIEETLGRVFRELKPYALFPIDEYFQAVTRTVDARPLPVPAERYPNGTPVSPPLAPCAPAARPQPVPALSMPKPLPMPTVAPFDITSPAAIVQFIRDRWGARKSLGGIAAELNRLGATPANGATWRQCDVKNVLIYSPRPQHLRKAA